LISVLNGAAGFLRSAIARHSSMRTTPRLAFHYDLLVEDGPRMGALIERAIAADRRMTAADDEKG
jgi:ribosome-binding factor A